MGRVAGVLDDPPGFPYTPPGIDVLEGGKLTSNNVAGSSHDPLQSTRPFAEFYRSSQHGCHARHHLGLFLMIGFVENVMARP